MSENYYRASIQQFVGGRAEKKFEVSADIKDDPDLALGYVLAACMNAMCMSDFPSHGESISNQIEFTGGKNEGFLKLLLELANAHRRWTADCNFDDCVSIHINE